MTPTPHPFPTPDPADRSPLRGAALADAARIAGARDLLLIQARTSLRLTLTDSLVAGEHWAGPLELRAGQEPLVRMALAADAPVRCREGEPRRIVGPYWASDAVLVPHHERRGSTIVVLAGFERRASDGELRYAAAAVRAFFPGDGESRADADRSPPATRMTSHRDTLTGLLNRDGWEDTLRRRAHDADDRHAVLLVDVAAGAPRDALDDVALRRVAAVVRANARSTDLVSRLGVTELVVLMRGGELSGCMETAVRVRTQLEAEPLATPVLMGWAAAPRSATISRAVEVARAMIAQERRAKAAELW
jgi:diguanylate cyclase (GGDEF)-like protein